MGGGGDDVFDGDADGEEGSGVVVGFRVESHDGGNAEVAEEVGVKAGGEGASAVAVGPMLTGRQATGRCGEDKEPAWYDLVDLAVEMAGRAMEVSVGARKGSAAKVITWSSGDILRCQ
jgi:hypothetical protein